MTARIVRSAGKNRPIDAEWVLVGWRENGRCMLLASEAVEDSTLTFAQRRQQWEFTDVSQLRAQGLKMARHLEADVLEYVLIEGDTFAECLAALLFGHGYQPDSVYALGRAGMGRRAGPYSHTQRATPEPAPLCLHRPPNTQIMFCEEPAGHYPATPHAHRVTWDEEDDQGAQRMLPASIRERQNPS